MTGRRALKAIARVFNEAVMGFLALVALGIALAPFALSVNPALDWTLNTAEWVIIAIFALDYLVTLVLSPRPGAYARSFWGLLDLAIVLGALISLFPWVSDELRSTPIFRLARLLRAAAFGTRAGSAVVRATEARRVAGEQEPLRVSLLTDDRDVPTPVEWKDVLSTIPDAKNIWYHISGATPTHIRDLGAATGVPTTTLDTVLGNASFPRAHSSAPFSMLFVWLPVLRTTKPAGIDRLGVLFMTNGELAITVSPTWTPIHEATSALPADRQMSSEPFGTRTLLRLLRGLLDRHEHVTGELERELRLLETLPVRDSSPAFFEQAFSLKRELSAMKADLWRLTGVLESLAKVLPLESLADEVSYLYETVENMREGILALLDLHMNVVSFDVNRFMRLLAVVSVLGLIPAVVGGLFGMNVAGNPWQITLSEVAFGVSMGMLFCLWLFVIKGWLR
jgi:Mg2+ and Co2+ transporter CorA